MAAKKSQEEDVKLDFIKSSGEISHDDVLLGPPPNMVKDEERPEDVIPDRPENKEAREFLKHAPTKGLWMPLGKEVKVMQCWRCKACLQQSSLFHHHLKAIALSTPFFFASI